MEDIIGHLIPTVNGDVEVVAHSENSCNGCAFDEGMYCSYREDVLGANWRTYKDCSGSHIFKHTSGEAVLKTRSEEAKEEQIEDAIKQLDKVKTLLVGLL